MKKKEWKKFNDNEILEGRGFFISYNPNTNLSKSGLGKVYNLMGAQIGHITGITLEDDGRAETALVKKNNETRPRKFYILNGDFRKEYSELVPKGFKTCYKFFNSKSEFKSGWSD